MDGKSLNDFVEKCTKGSYREIDEENRRIRELLKKRPHNIRSLKCALQDFERVYELLVEFTLPEKNKCLFSFIAYTFSARAGLVLKDKEYESIFYDDDVSQLYPGYYNKKYMIDGIKKWISDGEWNEEAINCQMSFMKKRYAAITSLDKARINSILDLEEDEMLAGYPELLNLAYEGKLDLNDYVCLLCNSNEALKYHINIPLIDWDKVQLGVERKINELLQSHEEPLHFQVVISDKSKNDYTDIQWKVYETIEKYRNGELQLFENNRNLFIELMNNDLHKAYEEIRNKRLDCFSDKMAEVTLSAFKQSSNADKNDIILNTKDIIRTMMYSSEFKGEQTETALNALKCGLESYLEQYCNSNKNSIAAAHAKYFMNTVDELLTELKK